MTGIGKRSTATGIPKMPNQWKNILLVFERYLVQITDKKISLHLYDWQHKVLLFFCKQILWSTTALKYPAYPDIYLFLFFFNSSIFCFFIAISGSNFGSFSCLNCPCNARQQLFHSSKWCRSCNNKKLSLQYYYINSV